MARVIVVGSLNMDLIVQVPRRPATGETLLGGTFAVLAGGKGLNQAVAAARLGAPAAMAGRVGDDDFGRSLLALLDAERIDRTLVRATAGIATGVAVITVAAGDNTIVVASGANMRLSPPDVADIPVQRGDICVGQLEVPLAATEAAFRRARAAGATTVLNAAPAQALPASFLGTVDVLVVNEIELAALSGHAITGDSGNDAVTAAAGVLAGDGRLVIATLGARGAVAVGRGGAHVVAGRAVKVVDSTGAGDCFVGALAAALADGLACPAALALANTAASLSVQRPGAAPSMPTLAELRDSA